MYIHAYKYTGDRPMKRHVEFGHAMTGLQPKHLIHLCGCIGIFRQFGILVNNINLKQIEGCARLSFMMLGVSDLWRQ